jgi:type II secretory pathway predicted ATPase ExeA
MSIERLRAHYGFTKMPFSKDIAPGALHRSAGHQEAVARVGFLVQEQVVGVVTGEVGAGKTVALRAAVSALDTSRHTVIYLANPTVGVRGLHAAIVSVLGGVPGSTPPPSSLRRPTCSPPRRPNGARRW